MRQADTNADAANADKLQAPEKSHAGRDARMNHDDHWAHLSEVCGKAVTRSESEAAEKTSGDEPTASSEPAYRSQQHTEMNKQARQGSPAPPTIVTQSQKNGGCDPALWNKLAEVSHGDISRAALDHPLPAPKQVTDGSAKVCPEEENGAFKKSWRNFQATTKRIGVDLVITELHFAIHCRDEKAVRALLAAGADPVSCCDNSVSPLAMAFTAWPEIALALAEALPDGAHANADENGDTEVHLATDQPEVLYVLLSKGMRDSANNKGTTALMRAAKKGELLSVKYLLGKPPGDGSDNQLSRYLDRRDLRHGMNALGCACSNNHMKVAELLVRHGADLYQHPPRKSLVAWASMSRNTDLLRFLLAEGAAAFEADLHVLLFQATKQGWTEGVEALAGFASLTREQQYELMGKWVSSPNPTSATLAAISPLIPVDLPSVRSLMKNPRLLEVPFEAGSPELLRAMLDFFDRRSSFNYMVQASVSQLIDDGGKLTDADMGRTLLRFVLPRVSRVVNDKETVMRLLQLSEQLQDYTLVTEIKALNSSGIWLARKNIPLDPTSISDPVSREFLGLPKSAESQTKISGFLNTLKLLVSAPAEMPAVDGARLSNDLILALKSDAVGDEIDKVFDDHRISAIVSQGLKPLLQDLATQLTPDASTRVDAVCRFLIAYAFSRLAEDWRLTRHRAFELTQSHPQWQAMKQKIDAEIASFEDVAATILDTMSSEMLGASLPDVVTRLTLEAMNARSMEASLRGAFRTKLGLLDVPALRLAQACVSASRTWQAGSASSTAASAGTQNGSDALTALIRQAFAAQTRVAHLPKEFVDVSRQIDLDLVDDFNNLVWWQMDMVAVALGIDEPAPADDDSDHVISDSDDGVEPKENEKSRYRQSA
jgi:ankyrin repeat protein